MAAAAVRDSLATLTAEGVIGSRGTSEGPSSSASSSPSAVLRTVVVTGLGLPILLLTAARLPLRAAPRALAAPEDLARGLRAPPATGAAAEKALPAHDELLAGFLLPCHGHGPELGGGLGEVALDAALQLLLAQATAGRTESRVEQNRDIKLRVHSQRTTISGHKDVQRFTLGTRPGLGSHLDSRCSGTAAGEARGVGDDALILVLVGQQLLALGVDAEDGTHSFGALLDLGEAGLVRLPAGLVHRVA